MHSSSMFSTNFCVLINLMQALACGSKNVLSRLVEKIAYIVYKDQGRQNIFCFGEG